MSGRKILGEAPATRALLQMIQKVAGAKTNVLIIGESGTGKELAARMIHDSGPLKDKPFIPVNCGAIPENLIESEMFGHKRGSFTGAVADKPGLFEAANGGTLFLDEVGELPLALQVKLLRAIQERSFRRVGGNEDIRVDVRIIAATNRDLEAAVTKGTFREDLYYRLNVILISMPPLRERKGDVKLLSEHFLKKSVARRPGGAMSFAPETLEALQAHDWPGNIRELENVIERAVALANGLEVTPDLLPPALQKASRAAVQAATSPADGASGAFMSLPAPDFSKGKFDLEALIAEVEKKYVSAALDHAAGDHRVAAELLGITFRSLRSRLTKLGLELEKTK